jgi:RNA polymerase sigma-70 factor (ECF subfamily)
MPETSISLFERLRQAPDADAWQRLVDLYTPLIQQWLQRYVLAHQDVEDLVQEVLTVLVRKLPGFEREPRTGSFRRWLRSITINCLRDFWRAQRFRPRPGRDQDFALVLEQLDDPESDLSRLWDQQHDEHVTRRLLEMIRPRFQATTWQAFQRVALDGVPAEQTARELGLSVNAVFIAKSRVLRLLREERQKYAR